MGVSLVGLRQYSFFCLVCFVVAFYGQITGALVNSLFDPQLGLATVGALITGIFVLLGILMVSMGLKHRAHRFSKKDYKSLLVLPVSVIVVLAILNVFLLPQEIKDQDFYGKALSTNEFVTKMVERHYDSEDGTWYYSIV